MSATANINRGGMFATARRGGITLAELGEIRGLAAKGTPLSAIAQIIGRSIEDVRAMAPDVAKRPTYRSANALEPEPAPKLHGFPPMATEIICRIVALYGVPLSDLQGYRRRDRENIPRQHLCFDLCEAGYALKRIGEWLGGRDHATIMNNRDRHAERLAMKVAAE